ncbi:hypothetical protein [Marinoscillum sp. MHG1-6]|uniref:hypothetical protein n=1 Tax=Marinoscillum sp. MHG1-6 TaxID=2959627 RepID=UPI0021570820|nr:hypothetical protein [Marinoscillum sp. MHG1-6]
MTAKEIEITSDVVIRFLAHEQYGTENKAIKALSNRLPEQTDVQHIFERHCNIFSITKELVIKKLSNSNFKDSLFEKIRNQIAEQTNSQPEEAGAYINWCYFFYILK